MKPKFVKELRGTIEAALTPLVLSLYHQGITANHLTAVQVLLFAPIILPALKVVRELISKRLSPALTKCQRQVTFCSNQLA